MTRRRDPEALVTLRSLGRLGLVALSTTLYALTLQWVYVNLITVPFGYAGYSYHPGPWQATVLTVAMTAVVAAALPPRLARVSHVVLWILFSVCVAPAMLMVNYTGYVSIEHGLLTSATIGGGILVAAIGTRLLDARAASLAASEAAAAAASASTSTESAVETAEPAPALAPTPAPARPGALGTISALRRRLPSGSIMWAVVAVHSLVTYALLTATVGLSLRFIALDDVYDVRAVYADEASSSGLLGYLLSGQANVINTMIIVRGLMKRNWTLLIVGVAGQMVLFSGTGFKTILFSFPAVLLVGLLMRRRTPRSGLWLVIGSVALMAASAVADEVQGGLTWTSLFSRRFLITPGLLTSVYADFFSQNPVAQLSGSVLRWWVGNPYDQSIPREVGQYLLPGSQLAANANLFADGLANFGPAGVIGVGALLLAFLRVVDRASRGLPVAVGAMVMVMPSVTLSNTSLLTAMLSHGLAVGVLLLWTAPRDGWGRVPTPQPATAENVEAGRGRLT
ncbi:hypothetical protein ACPEEZ_13980 [Frigoribacterium sp. 2-23]|uniref:hypothetical protein n=1 Tax=Frigoribacterium sp. 2-23 TaxID=3415006 RepID=UPI003C7020D1